MSADDKMFDDIIERDLFLLAITEGTPPLLAAYEVRWTPHQMRKNMEDPDFAVLVEVAKDQDLDALEKVLNGMARKEHFGALQMILYNKRPNQWKDVKRIEMKSEIDAGPGLKAAVREGLFAYLLKHGPKALQPGGALDDEILDAEVVDFDETG